MSEQVSISTFSPVPIRCHLANQEEVIITGDFDSVDENIGVDKNPILKFIPIVNTKIRPIYQISMPSIATPAHCF